jgi:hypothetical protein
MSLAIAAAVGACSSTALPPALAPYQRERLTAARCDRVAIGVERFEYPVYSDRLVTALRGTRLFRQVDQLDAFATPPTFVARVQRPIYGMATIPWLTGVSGGVIPTTVQEEHGYAFTLDATAGSVPPIAVEYTYSGPSTLGWGALALNMSRDRTANDVYQAPRLIEALAWALATQQDRICE